MMIIRELADTSIPPHLVLIVTQRGKIKYEMVSVPFDYVGFCHWLWSNEE
jgi:hypothetical protein